MGEGSGWDLRVRPAAPAPAAPGSLEIWESGNLEIQEPGNLELWKSGTWKSGNLGSNKNPENKLVRSPDPQPRNVRLGKRYVTPVVFFRYTVGTVYFMVSLCFWHCVSKQPSNSKIPKCQILSIVNIAVSERLSPKTLQILYFLHVFVQKC